MEKKKTLTRLFPVVILFVSLLFVFSSNNVNASHFRGGTMSWVDISAGGTPNTAQFSVRAAFTRSSFLGTSGDGFPAIGDVIFEGVGATQLSFGDGGGTGTLQFLVTAIDPANDWLEGLALEPGSLVKTTIDHTYLTANNAGVAWDAAAGSCCRSYIDANNYSGSYSMHSLVDFLVGNTPPVCSMPLLINLSESATASFFVGPTFDPDLNSTLRYRLATSLEAGPGFNQPFGLSINNVTGEATWDNTSLCGSWSCQIIIEDSDIVAGTLLNSIAIDFLIKLDAVCPGPVAPVNDHCHDAIPISCGQSINGTTLYATEDYELGCNGFNTTPGVWYIYTPVASGTVTATTCGGFTVADLQLSAFTGTCGSLTCITSNDDDFSCPSSPVSSTITFAATAGTPYYLLVHTLGTGLFTLSVENTVCCDLVASIGNSTDYNGYDIACNGGANGAVNVEHTGGTFPYSFLWSDGQTSQTASGLTAGNYSVTVFDAVGCSASATVTMTQPSKVTVTAEATSDYNGYDVRCFGGSDGEATATAGGGVGGFAYLWSDGQTSNPATGLSATTYEVTVTDDNGCQASDDVTLNEPPQLVVDAGPNQTVYYGYPDSACATLNAEGAGGGVPAYEYDWSDGSPVHTTTVCPPTSTVYYVTLTDQNGCEVVDSVKVCAIDVRCGHDLTKVTICHETGSGTQTLCVALTGAKNHIRTHAGDQLAACGTLKVCSFTPPSAKTGDEVEFFLGKEAYEGKTWLGAFPNPFADNTAVRFILPEDAQVSVQIFDVTGKMVAELFNGNATAGSVNEVSFNGNNFTNGVYFLTLTNNGERVVEKLVLAR